METVRLNIEALAKPANYSSSPGQKEGFETVFILADRVVRETVNKAGGRVLVPRVAYTFSGPWLLRLLTCAYAKGVLASEDISRKLARELPRSTPPPQRRVLRRFRRLNRDLVQNTLEKTLRQLRIKERRLSQKPDAPEAEIGCETTFLLHREAKHRLEEAVILDNEGDSE